MKKNIFLYKTEAYYNGTELKPNETVYASLLTSAKLSQPSPSTPTHHHPPPPTTHINFT